MKFRIIKLKASDDKIVDLPEGCIPIGYSIHRTEKPAGFPRNIFSEAMLGNNTIIETEIYVTVLQPITDKKDEEVDKKDEEDICFFCKHETTADKIGIRPICAKCLTEIYAKAKESHKSSDC